ncbi:hypothetical protein [Flavivirga sp. 57AJ16]|uniref:hypothetical protein n=1 Tax=Flavivirga sp. 57AJ16 TaxID=3025307 RepID=UPI0023651BE1|nr:hypothetical protein [Flavivirga sp. 57AJ16]MDD7886072.1 hypothetical protein [Flavivirga sp. 57AJ16]
MSKNIFKYLFIINIVILSGISGLYANSLANNSDICSVHQTEINNNVTFRPLQQNNDKNLIFEIAETQEIENEEPVSKSHHDSFQSFLAERYYISALNDLLLQNHKYLYPYKNYHDKSSTKLHVRLQVFII